MARSKTVSVTVRLPVGIVAILNDAVERGMFASTSDAVRSLVGRTIQATSQDAVGGPMKGMEIGSASAEAETSTAKAMEKPKAKADGEEDQQRLWRMIAVRERERKRKRKGV